MAEFIFDGTWEVLLPLPKIARLRDERFKTSDNLRTVRLDGLVPLEIKDEENYDPDPLPEQLNAVHYLMEQEEEVLETLLHSLRKRIYPVHQETIDFTEELFPDLENTADLANVVAINKIIIDTNHKDGMAYIRFEFEYRADEEYGLGIILHRKRCIDFARPADLWLEKIFLDTNENNDDYFNNFMKRIKTTELQMPLPKYNKLKPWQEKANYKFIMNLK